MYKDDLVLNNLKWLIYHKTQPNHLSDGEVSVLEFLGVRNTPPLPLLPGLF